VRDNDPSVVNVAGETLIPTPSPGGTSQPHPTNAIPLPPHGFAMLDSLPHHDPDDVSAVEAVTAAAVLLMQAAAANLGLSAHGQPHLDLDEARLLITALAGLLAASQDFLGGRSEPLRTGLATLQTAFRESSSFPDEPGHGPGEQLLS
jgi:hypothetical protein